MAFRAEEAAQQGLERAKNYLIPRHFTPEQRQDAERILHDVRETCGPVVESYPTWHPIVANHDDRRPETFPSEQCGYKGLDHTICFAHGFITCPYGDKHDGLIELSDEIHKSPCANIEIEELDVRLYNESTRAFLVRCEWSRSLEADLTIPKSLAVPLMLEKEVPGWRWAQRPESWETMRPYLLGRPHGSRSSLFVTQETATAMKKIYMAMVDSGMFGSGDK
jgi:hypothetical protein